MLDQPRLDRVMRRLDDFIRDEAKRPYFGWHDDHRPGRPYQPVIQQVRAEFEGFLGHILAHGLDGTALQIGLGISGGSHVALRQIFDRVVSIDCDPDNIERFRNFHQCDSGDIILQGLSTDPTIIASARDVAADASLLFIDAGHLFAEVRADWENYRSLVRPGGLICFHDHVPRPADYDVLQVNFFIDWLEHHGVGPITKIGTELGIACYSRD
jgi:predicted O-methyltransferase YrrM